MRTMELTIKRPDGTTEIISRPDLTWIRDAQFAKIQEANRKAGRGEVVSYRLVETDDRTPAERERGEIDALYAKAERYRDTNPARCIEKRKEADALKAAWIAKYPRTPREIAIRTADDYASAANDGKASAGLRAVERLRAGEDIETVLAEMRAEWSAYASAHVD